MIVIVDYKTSWPTEFETERAVLVGILGPLALRIDHIGSTSVPGLAAKDIIDVQVTVRELSGEIIFKLTDAGYSHDRSIASDHVPEGEDPDPKRWAKIFFTQPEGRRLVNLHVRVAANPNQRYPLLFRDYLRAHPNSARSIALVKREIARLHPDDLDAYYAVKDPVCDLIWDAALEWADRSGWTPGR